MSVDNPYEQESMESRSVDSPEAMWDAIDILMSLQGSSDIKSAGAVSLMKKVLSYVDARTQVGHPEDVEGAISRVAAIVGEMGDADLDALVRQMS